jgi:putative intracellular protease/amidase
MEMAMNRREFARTAAVGAALAVTGAPAGASEATGSQPGGAPAPAAAPPPLTVAMLVHPDMVLLDLVGPQTVLSLSMAKVHLVWKERTAVSTDVGITVQPTTTFTDCPERLDVLFVPGGLKGTIAAMDDRDVVAFLASRGQHARYVTGVCTGGLLLGAAGLLRGYRATSHWYVRDLLPMMGAAVAPERVVVDRNRITGGGVTAGIDFGLTLAAILRGEDYARRVQLVLEYDPRPPHASGTPETAGAAMTEDVRRRRAPLLAAAQQAAQRARARLGT